ncbi:SCO family protein [Flavobacteriaceae bacterium]|nr:SCO family protein [Flavobacteriaceae bacterium]MDA9244705.1 SCO family protein [Flavobacteriaceae bacterium]MDA9886490.1 SCO family protein [Flavobacteriaceae bacterium]MDA9984791.1 SCO family protein [Flavobacteriaceae bacterium]MDB4187389.1 SCO family protein [Flavobacteriaceae bacterium]
MEHFFTRYKTFLLFFSGLSAIILYLFFNALTPRKILPIYQPAEVSFELVDSSLQHIKKYHKIADFKLTNQNGQSISQRDYENRIYVADFFFTTCPSICPIMTDNMVYIQQYIMDDENIKLLSFSVTPAIDSVPQLKKYALEKGVIDAKWNLLTGNKKEIYTLARKSYFVVKEDGDGGPHDMIHTENFVLVDPDKRIRGYYDGTSKTAMDSLKLDLVTLKEEYGF